MLPDVTWSLIADPGDSMAGALRRSLGIDQSLELISSNISVFDLAKIIPDDGFRPEAFTQTLSQSLDSWRKNLTLANPDKALEDITKIGGRFISQQHESYPESLLDLGDCAPVGLWVIGNLDSTKGRISVVGSRIASDYGLQMTRQLVEFSVERNWLIVSGGAIGIDAAASEAALTCGGSTWIVLAGGLDRPYPKRNVELFERAKQTGALISERPPGTSPARDLFLQRNRLIAALGKATVVVEAGFRSGTINTAFHANELSRAVAAIPGRADSVRSAGCHRLIREGRAELVATPDHLLELMGGQVAQ